MEGDGERKKDKKEEEKADKEQSFRDTM